MLVSFVVYFGNFLGNLPRWLVLSHLNVHSSRVSIVGTCRTCHTVKFDWVSYQVIYLYFSLPDTRVVLLVLLIRSLFEDLAICTLECLHRLIGVATVANVMKLLGFHSSMLKILNFSKSIVTVVPNKPYGHAS